jgi:CheY-like chemotaxis protein
MAPRVLVIEDNAYSLDLMVYVLQAFGYVPLSARDGGEGVARALADIPDLILCDIQLPILDGYEVAQRLKSDPATAAIPLVAVTAMAMVGDREKVMAAGFDAYITKPIQPETFIAQIEACFHPVQDLRRK